MTALQRQYDWVTRSEDDVEEEGAPPPLKRAPLKSTLGDEEGEGASPPEVLL